MRMEIWEWCILSLFTVHDGAFLEAGEQLGFVAAQYGLGEGKGQLGQA